MSDLHALAARLEKATDDDAALGRDLWEALTGECVHRQTEQHIVFDDPPFVAYLRCLACGERVRDAPPPILSSLDAAVALCERVLPGHSLSVGQNVHHKYWHALVQRLSEHDAAPYIEGEAEAPTPALALCLAVVRAKIAELGGKP